MQQMNCDGDQQINTVLWESYSKRARMALNMKMPA
jgi:hypothetical protein